MNRRSFLNGLMATSCLTAFQSVTASPLTRLVTSPSADGLGTGKFDENLIVFISDLHCNPGGYQPDHLRKVVNRILNLPILPRNVIAFGDLAYLTGKVSEYEFLKPILKPLEDAGITLTLGMGNHDHRARFAQVFPEQAAKTKLQGRYVFIVETPHADFILLDSLQESEDPTTWITPGALNEEQKQWLEQTLKNYTKPVFVGSHHPLNEVGISDILVNSPTCCGYIYGHNHRWQKHWIKQSYSSQRIVRAMCLPSTGHWGDIGFVTFSLDDKKAVAVNNQSEFFFPQPAATAQVPEQWQYITEENNGDQCTFMYTI